MATHSSTLARRIPWTEEPSGLWSIESQRIGHDFFLAHMRPGLPWGFIGGANGKELAYQYRRGKRCEINPWVGKMLWRRVWQPTPVLLPGGSHE